MQNTDRAGAWNTCRFLNTAKEWISRCLQTRIPQLKNRTYTSGSSPKSSTQLKQGVSNWRMPWHTSGKLAFSPVNVTSKKPYRGINTVCLWASAQAKGYERGEWGTYQ